MPFYMLELWKDSEHYTRTLMIYGQVDTIFKDSEH